MIVRQPAIWFPAVRTGGGADVFTRRLCEDMRECGLRAEITWLPHRAEFAPWSVSRPKPPSWANLIHVNSWLPPRFIPGQYPVVATIHHSVHHPDARAYKGWLRGCYHRYWIAPNERRVLRRADRLVGVSHFVAGTARETLVDVPIEVIYNGIDTERFRPGGREGQQVGPFRLLYVGSWMARKGVDLLAPIMRELGDGFELHYTGGNCSGRAKMGMPSNMRDIGRLDVDEVVTALQDADALLFPSRSEGFGLVAAEAMSCGCPVVAFDNGAVSEVVRNAETGFLCPIDDIGCLVERVREMARQPALYAGMSRRGREVAVNEFDRRRVADAYCDVYKGALSD